MNDTHEIITFFVAIFIIVAIILTVGVIVSSFPEETIKQNEENNIIDRDRNCYGIILFTASWCKVCQEIKPEVNRLNENGAGIAVFDVDESPEIAKQNNITVFPTFIVYDNRGEILRTHNIVDIYKIMEKLK